MRALSMKWLNLPCFAQVERGSLFVSVFVIFLALAIPLGDVAAQRTDSPPARAAALTVPDGDSWCVHGDAESDANHGRGRLQDQETPRGTVFYAYDARGNLARLWTDHTGGANTSYGYDELNRLSTVTDTVAGVVNYGYDLVGNQATVALPNGVTSTYGYDTLNRLLTVTRKQGAATQATYTYTLDAVGRRTKNVESGGRTANWTYDVLSRLTSEAVTGGTTPGTIGYQFDNVGNRQVRTSNVTAVPATVTGYTPNDGLTSDTYDANGNTVSSVNGTDGYDAENHLTTRALPNSGGTVMIAYDGDGNKVTESSGGVVTSFLVSGLNPTGYTQTIEEFQGGAISRAYVWGNGLAPLAQRSGSAVTYPVTDGQGSVRALTNAAGAVTDTYTYDAYGILIGRTGTTSNRYLYCGYEFCEPLGQYYLRARYYDQSKGRFPTMDAWEGNIQSPQSLHKYSYSSGSPINRYDPSGHNDFSIAGITNTMGLMGQIAARVTPYVGSAGAVATTLNKINYSTAGRGAMWVYNMAQAVVSRGGQLMAYEQQIVNEAGSILGRFRIDIIIQRFGSSINTLLEGKGIPLRAFASLLRSFFSNLIKLFRPLCKTKCC